MVDNGPYRGSHYYDGDGWYPDNYYPAYYAPPVAVGLNFNFGHGGYYHGGYGGYRGGFRR